MQSPGTKVWPALFRHAREVDSVFSSTRALRCWSTCFMGELAIAGWWSPLLHIYFEAGSFLLLLLYRTLKNSIASSLRTCDADSATTYQLKDVKDGYNRRFWAGPPRCFGARRASTQSQMPLACMRSKSRRCGNGGSGRLCSVVPVRSTPCTLAARS
jgi:hypothetical protein